MKEKWIIEFYDKKVEKDTFNFPEKIVAKLIHILELLEEYGNNLGNTKHTSFLRNGLYEIRAKGKEGIGRCIYCYQQNKKIIILHSFIKKTQKTPKKDIEIALKRKKEIENEKTNI